MILSFPSKFCDVQFLLEKFPLIYTMEPSGPFQIHFEDNPHPRQPNETLIRAGEELAKLPGQQKSPFNFNKSKPPPRGVTMLFLVFCSCHSKPSLPDHSAGMQGLDGGVFQVDVQGGVFVCLSKCSSGHNWIHQWHRCRKEEGGLRCSQVFVCLSGSFFGKSIWTGQFMRLGRWTGRTVGQGHPQPRGPSFKVQFHCGGCNWFSSAWYGP